MVQRLLKRIMPRYRDDKLQPKSPYALSSSVKGLLQRVKPFTMTDPLRLATLYGLVRELGAAGVAGDIVETGVWRGGTAAVMGSASLPFGARNLWLYDSFQGMPEPTGDDGKYAQEFAGKCVGSEAAVREVLNQVSFPTENIIIRKGLFQDTFKLDLPSTVMLLHIDSDWYDSVMQTLVTFYPLVHDGGLIVLDDFGYWEGCRKAFYAFCRQAGIEPLLERVGNTQAFWRKRQEHTRDVEDRYTLGTYRPNYQ
jgi:O-methyltransferase